MPSNAPRVPKAQQRDAARQKALEMRAAQEKRIFIVSITLSRNA